MNFTKMHGAGNDFIIINNMEEGLLSEQLSYLAKSLCRRRFSVGADGLMAVDFPEQGGDYRMRFFNADGSVGEMCGNGARCIARSVSYTHLKVDQHGDTDECNDEMHACQVTAAQEVRAFDR